MLDSSMNHVNTWACLRWVNRHYLFLFHSHAHLHLPVSFSLLSTVPTQLHIRKHHLIMTGPKERND